MRNRVFVAAKIWPAGIEKMRLAGLEVTEKYGLSGEELVSAIREISPHAIVVRHKPDLGASEFDAAPKLEQIVRAGIGTDNIDCAAAKSLGIAVSNVPGGNEQDAAEHTITLMLACLRNIPPADSYVKSGPQKWEKELFRGKRLQGKTVGIIGCGRVGRRVAGLAQAFGAEVLAYDPPHPSPPPDIPFVNSLEELLRRSDIVTLHVLTTEKRCLIGSRELSLMKPTAYLINTSRGVFVDLAALRSALRKKIICGAGLDVYPEEPPPPEVAEDLKSLPVVATPHLGGETEEAQKAISLMVADIVIDKLKHNTIRNAIGIPYLEIAEREALKPERVLRARLVRILKERFGAPQHIRAVFEGEWTSRQRQTFMQAILAEALDAKYEKADEEAKNRGVSWEGVQSEAPQKQLRITFSRGKESASIGGGADKDKYPVLTALDDYPVSGARLLGEMFLVVNRNVPGAWHKTLGVLYTRGVNIGGMISNENLSETDERALVVIRIIGGEITEELIREIRALPEVVSVQHVSFPQSSE